MYTDRIIEVYLPSPTHSVSYFPPPPFFQNIQYWTHLLVSNKMIVRFILIIVRLAMARTITVDLGDELLDFIESLIESGDYRTQSEVIRESLRLLREKKADSRLQALRDLLAEGLSSGEPVAWEKDAFLKQARALSVKTVKLTPKASQDLEDIGYYGYHHFGEEQADKYINPISDIRYFSDYECS